MARLIAYLRVSTEGQAKDGYGLDVQEAQVRAFCKAHGHRIVRIESDDGKTGTLPDTERPALLVALKAVRDGEAEGIVVPGLHRLARLLHVQEAILGKVWQMGGRLFSAESNGEIAADDPDDPMRTAMRQMMGVFAQLDRAMLIKRMRNGRAAKAATGGYAYGSPAYGQKADQRRLVADPAENATVARILSREAEGASVRQIAAELNAEGIPAKRGGQWQPETVARVIRRAKQAKPS